MENQNLIKETVSFLTLLQLNYWCESEEEKQEILSELENTDKIREEKLRDKYNLDNIFKDRNKNQEQTIVIIEKQEKNFIKKILKKIMTLFRRS